MFQLCDDKGGIIHPLILKVSFAFVVPLNLLIRAEKDSQS